MTDAARVKIGLIGCGVIGVVHARRLAADSRAEIAAVCDPNPASAEKLRREFAPSAGVYSDPMETFEQAGLDAVVLCSPTPLHYQQACAALERGLHVLCEKPLAQERKHLLDLVQRSDAAKRILSVAYQRRFESLFTTARRELHERADWYGPLQEVHVFVCERWEQTIHGTWRDDPSTNLGYIGDAGSHQIDACGFISGRSPIEATARGHHGRSRVEIVTRVLATLQGDVGFVGHFVGNASHWREDLHFHCREADLLIRDNNLYRAKDNELVEIPAAERLPDSNPDRGLVDAILLGTPTPAPAQCAVPIFDWTSAILASVREGRSVQIGAA